MHIILGATGHVGSSLTKELLKKAQPVTVVTHDESKSAEWLVAGAEVAVVDVHDSTALREVFDRGTSLFLLNPPAAPDTDTIKEEKSTLNSILKALEGSAITKVVCESTYGAQPGEGQGDFNVLFEMEERLKAMGLQVSVIRAAYYMSNWDMALETAMKDGIVQTFYPADFKIPMVSPEDLGQVAARLMTENSDSNRLINVEGPRHYSPNDVANSFSKALKRPVRVVSTPQEKWISEMKKMGFSTAAAKSMSAMTELTMKEIRAGKMPKDAERGSVTLSDYIRDLVETGAATKTAHPEIHSLTETL